MLWFGHFLYWAGIVTSALWGSYFALAFLYFISTHDGFGIFGMLAGGGFLVIALLLWFIGRLIRRAARRSLARALSKVATASGAV